MTLMVVAPGLRDAVQVVGYSFSIPPDGGTQAVPTYLETVEYFIDGTAHVSRPLQWTDQVLGIASPDVGRKWQLKLPWRTLNPRDYVQLQELQSKPGPIDVTLWRPLVERFTMDGVKRTVTLSALPAVVQNTFALAVFPLQSGTALIANPPDGWRAYQAQVYVDGVLKAQNYAAFPTAADAFGRCPVGIPADSATATLAKGVVVEVYYIPVFRCRRAGAECSFPQASDETLALNMEQLG